MNLPEILVSNCTGAILIIFLFLMRIQNSETKQVGAWLNDSALIATLLALITETLSFLLDGRMFTGCRFLLYLTNTLCTGASAYVGFVWCLFVDFRIYRNLNRLRKKFVALGLPFFIIMGFLGINLFGTGIIFSLSDQNVYSRGSLNLLLYILLLVYYVNSILTVRRSRHDGLTVKFFPILYFVVPCIIGTVVQSLFYGIATGWLAVSVSFVFVHIQLQNFNTYIDELSGLFNRKYLTFCLERAHKQSPRDLYGIMLDVNDFKSINDNYGHSVGDQALQAVGRILSSSLPENAIALRVGGDEFIVLFHSRSDAKLDEVSASIKTHLQAFNQTTTAPFRLSFSMGSARYDGHSTERFLNEMDANMYQEKKAYHQQHDRHPGPRA